MNQKLTDARGQILIRPKVCPWYKLWVSSFKCVLVTARPTWWLAMCGSRFYTSREEKQRVCSLAKCKQVCFNFRIIDFFWSVRVLLKRSHGVGPWRGLGFLVFFTLTWHLGGGRREMKRWGNRDERLSFPPLMRAKRLMLSDSDSVAWFLQFILPVWEQLNVLIAPTSP